LKTFVLTDAELTEIVSRDESHFFDIKGYDVSGKAIQKVAVAFSNADGGELIKGIRDKKRGKSLAERWEGVADIEGLNGHLQALFDVKPALDLKYEFLKWDGGDGYALRVLIEKGSLVCGTGDGTIYLRQGAQSLPIKDADRIQQLSFAKGAISFEDATLPDLPAEQIVESTEIGSFLADYSPKTDPLEFAINQNLLDFKTWQPRTAIAQIIASRRSIMVPPVQSILDQRRDNSEPILYSCPSCRAKYKIVTIDSPGNWHHGKIACLECNALFPAGDERVLFKYILMWPPSSERKRR